MKKILSASICAIALCAALPALAADDTAKPMMHHSMHHMHHMKSSSMMGPHTKMKKAGDPSTDALNAKSLDAARGGSTDSSAPAPMSSAPMSPAPMSPAPMSPAPMAPSSGTSSSTMPMNAPSGH